ncbi:MAG TPA: hypothetical protein VF447_04525, partial [Terriglobales bacterium]
NAPDFVGALLPGLLGQVMEHDSAKYKVELRLGKWKSLSHATPENDLHAGASRLSLRPRKHLGRGVDTVHRTARSYATLGCNRERAGSTTNVQYRLSIRDVRPFQHRFAKSVFFSEKSEPDR